MKMNEEFVEIDDLGYVSVVREVVGCVCEEVYDEEGLREIVFYDFVDGCEGCVVLR